MSAPHRVGIVGYGGMGSYWARELAAHPRWEVAAICDLSDDARARAGAAHPAARLLTDAEEIMRDPTIAVVGLFTLADQRPALIRRALATGKHILAEKPLGDDVAGEVALLDDIERSGRLVAVNLFNRNAWYHHEALRLIAQGEIGQLAALRVRHITPGLAPFETTAAACRPEGPPFHDCGMHYVDVARWYAGSDYVRSRWHAQGLCLWGVPHPWYVSVHGAFANGVAYEITQGFCYGQLAQEPVVTSGLEAIGTQGVIRLSHDFATVDFACHGVTRTVKKTGPYGSKKIDVMVDVVARSIDAGRNLGFPSAHDAVIASRISQEMLDDAIANGCPAIGDDAELRRILERKREAKRAAAAKA